MLYAGTLKALPRKAWQKAAPDLSVASLAEHDATVKAHFDSPEVQSIGSTASCGCDFPCVTLQSGGWPGFDSDEDPEQVATERYNREALVRLLRSAHEQTVELYCVWFGDFGTPPLAREEILLTRILDADFRFKERGFYLVRIL
ncbi:MAG TPA: hypothetical protein VJ731_13265 [Terriglobales bacterium]|nr:hypothetical protein [Terriglobales bacterium]